MRRTLRRLALAALAGAVLIGVVLGIAIALRREIALRVLRAELAAHALPITRGRIVSFGPRELVIEDLGLVSDTVRIDRLTAHYPAGSLARGRIDRVSLAGVRVQLTPLRQALASDAPPLDSLRAALAVLNEIQIERATVDEETAAGPLRAVLDGRIGHTRDGLPEIDLGFAVSGPVAAPVSPARADPGSWSGELVGRLNAHVREPARAQVEVRIDRGRIAVAGRSLDAIAGHLSGTSDFAASHALAGNLAAVTSLLPDLSPAPASLALRLDDRSFELRLRQGEHGDEMVAAVELVAPDLRGGGPIVLRADAELGSPAAIPALHSLSRAGLETLCAQLEVQAKLPVLAPVGSPEFSPGAVGEVVRRSLLAALTITGTGPGRLGEAEGIALAARLQASPQGDGLAFELGPGSTLSASRVATAWLEGLGAPTELARDFARGATAELSGRGLAVPERPGEPAEIALDHLRLDLHLRGKPASREPALAIAGDLIATPVGLSARLDVAAALDRVGRGRLAARGFELRLPLALDASPEEVRAHLRAEGTLSVTALAGPSGFALAEPWSLRLGAAAIRVPSGANRAAGTAYTVSLEPKPARIVRESPPLELRVDPGPITLESPGGVLPARTQVGPGSASIPSLGLELADLVVDLAPRATAPTPLGRFRIGRIRLAHPELGARVAWLDGEIHPSGGALAVVGQVGLRPPGVRASWSATLDSARGTVAGHLDSGPLRFAPGQLQPGELLSSLAALSHVRGEARVRVESALGPGGTVVAARLCLDDISAGLAGVELEGLSTELELASVAPPWVPGGACVAVRRIQAGLGPPIEFLDACFGLAPGAAEPEIEQARFRFLGGRIELRDTRLDVAGRSATLELEVAGLELSELLRYLAIEGLSGEGRLGGRVPIAQFGDDLVIGDASLAAAAPGILRYRSARARELLRSGGESVELLLSALEDFHYHELRLALSHSAGDDTHAALHLKGNNPAVMAGHPFHINIDLSGNTRSLLEALERTWHLKHRLSRPARP